MKLKDAMICINCEEIHTGWTCPKCAKGPSYHLDFWIKSGDIESAKRFYKKPRKE